MRMSACSRGQYPSAFVCFISAGKSPVAFGLHLIDNLTDW
jgi:hypothetical protein